MVDGVSESMAEYRRLAGLVHTECGEERAEGPDIKGRARRRPHTVHLYGKTWIIGAHDQ
jgi:hypothetical protein